MYNVYGPLPSCYLAHVQANRASPEQDLVLGLCCIHVLSPSSQFADRLRRFLMFAVIPVVYAIIVWLTGLLPAVDAILDNPIYDNYLWLYVTSSSLGADLYRYSLVGLIHTWVWMILLAWPHSTSGVLSYLQCINSIEVISPLEFLFSWLRTMSARTVHANIIQFSQLIFTMANVLGLIFLQLASTPPASSSPNASFPCGDFSDPFCVYPEVLRDPHYAIGIALLTFSCLPFIVTLIAVFFFPVLYAPHDQPLITTLKNYKL